MSVRTSSAFAADAPGESAGLSFKEKVKNGESIGKKEAPVKKGNRNECLERYSFDKCRNF